MEEKLKRGHPGGRKFRDPAVVKWNSWFSLG